MKNQFLFLFFWYVSDAFQRRQWQPTPVLLPGKSHGQMSLVGHSPWGHEESDTTERLHFSLSCIGEGNGNSLQCSCLENPREGGAWWAVVCGIAQSRTRLKRLSSSRYLPPLVLRKAGHPTPVLLPGKSHGRRSLSGCNPWGRYGEGNGTPLQYSCLENPKYREAW